MSVTVLKHKDIFPRTLLTSEGLYPIPLLLTPLHAPWLGLIKMEGDTLILCLGVVCLGVRCVDVGFTKLLSCLGVTGSSASDSESELLSSERNGMLDI